VNFKHFGEEIAFEFGGAFHMVIGPRLRCHCADWDPHRARGVRRSQFVETAAAGVAPRVRSDAIVAEIGSNVFAFGVGPVCSLWFWGAGFYLNSETPPPLGREGFIGES